LANQPLSSAIGALEKALSGVGRHMLIGGVAVIARGVRRLTDDVDVSLWAEGVDIDALLRRLARHGIFARIADALSFARQNQVLLLRHTKSGTDIDLSLAWLEFESDALDRAELMAMGRQRVRVAIADDLIVYKAIAARERDLSDLERLFEIHSDTVDFPRVRRTVAELAGILEKPELVEGLERIARSVGTLRSGTTKRRTRRKGRPKRR
jgi:hypothetical protein